MFLKKIKPIIAYFLASIIILMIYVIYKVVIFIGEKMIKKQIEEIKEKLKDNDALIYKEDDHYYILFKNNISRDGILIQELNNDTVVIWCYDAPNCMEEDTINIIINTFHCNIIFPYIESENTLTYLLNNGFERTVYNDDDVDENMYKFPSVIKRSKI